MGYNTGFAFVRDRTLDDLAAAGFVVDRTPVAGQGVPRDGGAPAREAAGGVLFWDHGALLADDFAPLAPLGPVEVAGVQVAETSGTFLLVVHDGGGARMLMESDLGRTGEDLAEELDVDGALAAEVGSDQFFGYFHRWSGVDLAARDADAWVLDASWHAVAWPGTRLAQ